MKEFGVNMIGNFDAPIGTSEATRLISEGIGKSGLPFIKLTPANFVRENKYHFNLLHYNADITGLVVDKIGESQLRNDRYTIGFWFWELFKFPEKFKSAFLKLNEVWVASDFCFDLLKDISPVPVAKIPLPIIVPENMEVKKDNGDYIFLFAFDCHSYFERKNPLAVIQAFNNSFSENENVKLIIKANHIGAYPHHRERLIKSAKESHLSVEIIESVLSKEEMSVLMSRCDCYISLHRSEGFGLTMAEAMAMGKPCIATKYSGNLEFMNDKNSYLVDYKLVEIKESIGVYEKGGMWAEPDIDMASKFMKYVFCNRKQAENKGISARKYLKENFSPEIIGRLINSRLNQLYKS